jgi:hypothetical protein
MCMSPAPPCQAHASSTQLGLHCLCMQCRHCAFCRRETNDNQAILPKQDTSIICKIKDMQVVENLGAALTFLADKGASASGSASEWAGQIGAHHVWATQANVCRHTAGTSGSLRTQMQAGNSDSAPKLQEAHAHCGLAGARSARAPRTWAPAGHSSRAQVTSANLWGIQ